MTRSQLLHLWHLQVARVRGAALGGVLCLWLWLLCQRVDAGWLGWCPAVAGSVAGLLALGGLVGAARTRGQAMAMPEEPQPLEEGAYSWQEGDEEG